MERGFNYRQNAELDRQNGQYSTKLCCACVQVLSLRYSALCLLECETGLSGNSRGRHYDFCLVVLANPPPGLIQNLLPEHIDIQSH